MREKGKNEPLLSFHPWAGARPPPAEKPHFLSLWTVPAPGLPSWPSAPQQHRHKSNRTVPETLEPSAPAPVSGNLLCQGLSSFWFCTTKRTMQAQTMIRAPNSRSNKKNINNRNNLHCEKSMWVWMTSSTGSNTSYLFNIKTLAAAPACVIVCFPTISEHREHRFSSLGWGVQRWWGSALDVAGESTHPRQGHYCVSSTPHSYWGEKHNDGILLCLSQFPNPRARAQSAASR